MNINFLTEPTPHHEAIDLIRNKPAVSREIYNGLEQELKGRAMTITGIENFDLVQAVQDKIATLPAGADWKKLRKEIAADISPWLGEEEGLRRAQLLLNHHGRAAYAATNARIVHAQEDVFTHLMYRSSRTSKEPRASHKALDGLILPSNHPFWETHTPPWEFGCNCPDPIPLTADDADDAEREKPGSVATPGQLAALERGTLSRGPSQNFDIQTPLQRSGGTTGYQWSWRHTTLPYEEIRKRWTPDVAEKFEAWADGIAMEKGTTLLAHLTGLASAGGRIGTYRAATFTQAIEELGLDAKDAWTRQDVASLRTAMKKPDAVRAENKLAGIIGARKTGEVTGAEVKRTLQDVLDMLPPDIAQDLPSVEVHVVKTLGPGERGDYRPSALGAPRVRISLEALKGLRGGARRREVRRILSHEYMHWLHMESMHPKAQAYRRAIRDHYAIRTATDTPEPDGKGGFYRKDQFWKKYCGREYKEENGKANGVEIPSTYFELWETPEDIIERAHVDHATSSAFRETFSLVHTIFDSTP